ncbi:MAG: hypothetical protein Q4D60_09135 [Eubacteriales bacterium]|nr:hypothetical protein [Eubacteriales bacterium]
MNALIRRKLTLAGIDLKSMLERFMGNEDLVSRFLIKFAEDDNYDKLLEAMNAHEKEDAVVASHTLKGICGNLSMVRLFDLFSRQVEALREDDWEGAQALMPEIEDNYTLIMRTIRECGWV